MVRFLFRQMDGTMLRVDMQWYGKLIDTFISVEFLEANVSNLIPCVILF